MKQINTQKVLKLIIHMSVVIALSIVAGRFLSIQTPVIRIGFAWLPIVVIAYLHGPLAAGLSWAIADVLGFFLFNPTGIYHPGITASAFLSGLVLGLLIRKRPVTKIRTLLAVLALAVIGLFITSFWIAQITTWGNEEAVLLPTYTGVVSARILQTVILAPLQFFFIRLFTSEKSHVNRALRQIAA